MNEDLRSATLFHATALRAAAEVRLPSAGVGCVGPAAAWRLPGARVNADFDELDCDAESSGGHEKTLERYT